MKKVFLLVVAFFMAVAVVGCNVKGGDKDDKKGYDYDAIPDTMEASSYEIAFVTDIGQLKDKSFNQGTWEGLKRFAKENNKSYKYYQPAGGNEATDEDRIAAMNAAVAGGAKIIVCAGFMQGNALTAVATANPEVKFVFVDGWPLGLENVTAIVFQEEQAGYLAGYAAVKEGFTKLGFAGGGGGTNPACQRFGYGYIQGANAAAKELGKTVEMKYSWLHGASFSASAELQTMLEGWYSTGTQVVFACGGSMCTSAFAAAGANNGKVIGVDVDQAGDSATVITSAMKGLREGTMYALEKFYAGKWSEISDKSANLGVNDNAVGLPTEESSWGFKNFTVEEYNELFKKLQDKTIVVDATVEGAESKSYSNVTVDWVK
ncbi:MAG: BMP family ABC transporter substrate-binding protein [Bacilli bacterium]|nr:BMP family ABC transporter substrate-binding protein [Bacilli bacterium]